MVIYKKNKPYKLKTIFLVSMLIILIGITMNVNIIRTFRPIVRNIEKSIVLYKTRNFNRIETDEFIIKYENIDSETLKLIIDTAEDKYIQTTEVFKYKPKDKVLIVIYSNEDMMTGTTMLSKGQPPMGVYYGDSVHIINPEFWITKDEDIKTTFYKEGPMLHEFAHLFTDHIGKGNFPIWFTEGVSLYLEYKIDGYEWGKDIVFNEDEYSIEDLNNNFYNLNEYKAYTKSFRLVKTLAENHGIEELINIIELLGQGKNLNEFIYLFQES